jgi:hypothetical protein
VTKPVVDIITCPAWKARRPTQGLELCGQAQRLIMHHTAGHVRQLGDPTITTRSEAMQYARDIQGYHMDGNGWNDSGHNFLVCRAGFVLQGRWLTVSAIQAGHMVRSAHCPSQNDQIGIEFEHYGLEEMTTNLFDPARWIEYLGALIAAGITGGAVYSKQRLDDAKKKQGA